MVLSVDGLTEAPTAEAASARTRRPAHTRRILRRYFMALGYTPGQTLQWVTETVLENQPPDLSPTAAIACAARALDAWLRRIITVPPGHPAITPEIGRAALLALQPGRHWPAALFAPNPEAAFLAALYDALPIALPLSAPLSMPVQSLTHPAPASAEVPPSIQVPGLKARRAGVFGLTCATTLGATFQIYRVFLPGGITAIEALLMGLFAINFMWIALTMWTGLLGLYAVLKGGLPNGLRPAAAGTRLPKTAILIPVYNEAPGRIFAGVVAMYESLAATGQLEAFEFFVLSDSTNPDAWVAEEILWDATRRRLHATERLFYRRRFENTARKAGNLEEFCTRWGGRYETMLVLDADSLMEGSTIVQMAALMGANPAVGLLQTVPLLINRNTLFARAHQFASRLYGPVLATGLAAWHGGDGNYWGHNAMIRVRAFAAHAGMPILPGRPPFGGHILSHDFVEAALLRRAGWGVFMLPGLGGSYEESPPSLLDHAQRDRRWCQGNLQHLAVIGARGLHPASRFHLLTGIMSYLSSPLWFAFIVVGILAALQTRFELPQYFFPNRTPYPVWHVIDPELALRLFEMTMAVLLVPKIFGWCAIAAQPTLAALYGGRARAFKNVLYETLLSALIAPVQMLFQSRFVIEVLRGRDSGWKVQARDDGGLSLREAWHHHKHHAIMGCLLGFAAWAVSPGLLGWMAPALIGMIAGVGTSYFSAQLAVGLRARQRGILQIPEEITPPDIARRAAAAAAEIREPQAASGFNAVISDNRTGALHLALLSQYAPRAVTEPMALAHYRAHHLTRREALRAALEPRLHAAALADAETLRRLRRRLGGYR